MPSLHLPEDLVAKLSGRGDDQSTRVLGTGSWREVGRWREGCREGGRDVEREGGM